MSREIFRDLKEDGKVHIFDVNKQVIKQNFRQAWHSTLLGV